MYSHSLCSLVISSVLSSCMPGSIIIWHMASFLCHFVFVFPHQVMGKLSYDAVFLFIYYPLRNQELKYVEPNTVLNL